MEDKNKGLTYKGHEYSNEQGSLREQIENSNVAPTVGVADKVRVQLSVLLTSKLEVTLCCPVNHG